MKRVITVLLCLLLLSCTVLPVSATERRDMACVPTLTFDGTTAKCNASFSSFRNSITLTLSLWNGNTLIDSWSKSGTSYVSISEYCSVQSGKSYTLKVSGTCAGVSIDASPVTKTCP